MYGSAGGSARLHKLNQDEPVSGRDLSLIVEVAALNQKLKLMGHDAAKELDDKLISMLSRKAGASS